MIQALLFDSIPTSDFLGLENKKANSELGGRLLSLAKTYKCEFNIPIIHPHILPIIQMKKDIEPNGRIIYVTQKMPLALRNTHKYANSMMRGMETVIGLIPYFCDYVRLSDMIQIYNPESGKVLKREFKPRRNLE